LLLSSFQSSTQKVFKQNVIHLKDFRKLEQSYSDHYQRGRGIISKDIAYRFLDDLEAVMSEDMNVATREFVDQSDGEFISFALLFERVADALVENLDLSESCSNEIFHQKLRSEDSRAERLQRERGKEISMDVLLSSIQEKRSKKKLIAFDFDSTKQEAIITQLPRDVLMLIFADFSLGELNQLLRVCKKFYLATSRILEVRSMRGIDVFYITILYRNLHRPMFI
jgi:hypothetical protein